MGNPKRGRDSRCSFCPHPAHAGECTRLGPVTCQPVKTDSGTVLMRGRFPCACRAGMLKPGKEVKYMP